MYSTCIGNFYFTLVNMQPKHCSRLSAIQLLCIVKTSIIKMYGMDAILKPFVEDIKELVCACLCKMCIFINRYVFRKKARNFLSMGSPRFILAHCHWYLQIIWVALLLEALKKVVLLLECAAIAWLQRKILKTM